MTARARIIKLYEFLKLFRRFKMTAHTKVLPNTERRAINPNVILNVRLDL